ncbi:hypothetical protein T4B_6437 [Trichinella pseudospiralis]|uniref:Uncharacterized protein n=1 Tax=Trichinella pseudospiralis TaxID=6337 RepID=A0A0V1IAX0_TRIPS|nr:hypothetical protein T4B_6437 [Trichinella pseudospiralis]
MVGPVSGRPKLGEDDQEASSAVRRAYIQHAMAAFISESQKSTLRSLAKNMTSFLPSRFQSFKDKKKGAQPTSTAAESPRSDSSGDRDSTS